MRAIPKITFSKAVVLGLALNRKNNIKAAAVKAMADRDLISDIK